MRDSKLTIVASFPELMRRAKALGDAKKYGDPDKIAEAQKQHDDYHALCMTADKILTGLSTGDIF